MNEYKGLKGENEPKAVKTPSVPFLERGIGTRFARAVELAGGPGKAAKIAGVSPESLRRYINEAAKPTFEVIARLAHASGVSMDWIATGVGARSVNEPAAIYAATPEIKGLTLEDVQAIVSIVEGSSVLKNAPLEERARVWMELINSQLKNRARLRAEAAQMLREGPPQPD